jgi:spore coat polysaccharide biosynthesis protein SpsF (cytidylyltransferase family)/aryl-alcohol dehydrogenase-like predicted oxidoreductase
MAECRPVSASVRYVLQARLASGRLPAKALLQLGGYPIVVLAALRAARDGADVVVATSTEPADDLIADAARSAGLRVVRGPHENVLHRFILATEDLKPDDIAVRLTADNVVPDGAFVSRVVEKLVQSGNDYVGTRSPQNGLPHGLFAEAFHISALRQAFEQATTLHDRTDVTPWMLRNLRASIYTDESLVRFGPQIRCTIDTVDDYVRMQKVLDPFDDPVAAGFVEILERMAASADTPRFYLPFRSDDDKMFEHAYGRMVLGTAQFGMLYGVVNKSGEPDQQAVERMARTAIDHGVTDIDTARCYGNAEAKLGHALRNGWRYRVRLLSKIDPPAENAAICSDAAACTALVDAQVFASLHALRTEHLDVVMLREAWPLSRQNAILDRLEKLKARGIIGAIGLSAQSPEEGVLALKHASIGHLQIPFNVLDRRWRDGDFLFHARQRGKFVIHARSVYLQGLLADVDPAKWPRMDGVDAQAISATLGKAAADAGQPDRASLCLAFVRAHDWIDGIVVGVETMEQLAENFGRFLVPALDPSQVRHLETAMPRVPERWLNPSNWTSP